MAHGRGSAHNPPNRFEVMHYEPAEDEEPPSTSTQFLHDDSKSIISYNNSPDIGFDASINPYRGCEHGCAYCYARPTHEYLGFSAGLDFETRILVKKNAPALLRTELSSPRWKPQVLAISGVTDCYQPIERRLRLTRQCLEVLAEFRNPVIMVTKNYLVTRDIDLLQSLARVHAASVSISITTLQSDLASILEPRASEPSRRLAALEALSAAGVPCGVMVAPVIAGLNDHEMPAIVAAALKAGARFAAHIPLRLPLAVAPLFESWLQQHMPDRKQKVLNRVRSMRGGKLNDPRFGNRFQGDGIFAEQMHRMFQIACKKAAMPQDRPLLSTESFQRPGPAQLTMF